MDELDVTRVARVAEFPDYEVDSDGRVWSLKGHRGPRHEMSQRTDKDGYCLVSLTGAGREHTRKVHKLVLLAFVGAPEPGQQCRHLDGQPGNNHLTNLKWGTPTENADDKRRHGTMAAGENHYNSQKTECPYGHEYTPENTFIAQSGRRSCRTCQSVQRAATTAKRRAQRRERREAQ